MKICVLTHTFPRNPQDVSAAFMKEFCDGLVQNGHKVTLVTPFDPEFNRSGDPFKIITYKYIWPDSWHQLGYSRTMDADIKLKRKSYILLPFLLLFGFLTLYRTVKREKPDLISVHWIIPNGLICWLVYVLTGVPYVVTLPGTDAFLAEKSPVFGRVAKVIAEDSAALVSNSAWNLNKILKLGIKDKLNQVITYPVNVQNYKPLKTGLEPYKERYNLTKDNIILFAVGRLVYKKGFEYLLKALPAVIKKNPKVRLIIGGDGDLAQPLAKIAEELGLKDKVIFSGTVKRDEILYYYNMADIMVTPSIIDQEGNVDGRPLVILESMACGKPQVVTNLPGISDALVDGVNAILVEQKNSQQITDAIEKLISSPSLRQKMGLANIELAHHQLSTKNIGANYTQLFEQVFTNRK